MNIAVLFAEAGVENVWLIAIPIFVALVAFSFFMMIVSRYKSLPEQPRAGDLR